MAMDASVLYLDLYLGLYVSLCLSVGCAHLHSGHGTLSIY